jgi:hypothetical protein
MAQAPRTGSLEQVLRALRLLALSPAFEAEMQNVIAAMNEQAFIPRNLTDAQGNRFALTALADTEFGDPSGWVSTSFREVTYSSALLPVPPFPRLQLFAMPGRLQPTQVFDQEAIAGWESMIDVIVVEGNDQADPALRSALALADGFERLVRRNAPSLGGLVELIAAEGPPAPGGPVEREMAGNVAGVMQRFRVSALRSIL